MSSVRILVSYGGEWVESPEAGIFKFTGSKGKGMTVPKSITYRELLNKVYRLLMVDPNEFGSSMKVLYASSIPVPPAEIINDDDVNFFIGENSSNVSLRTPLCITLIQRSSYVQQNGYGEGGSQTFNAMPGTQEKTCDSFVPLAGIEENVSDFCVDNEHEDDDDVGTSSPELTPGDASVEHQLCTGKPQSSHCMADVDPITPVGDGDATAPNPYQLCSNPTECVMMREASTDSRKLASTASTKEATAVNASSSNQSRELETRQLFLSKKELHAKRSMLAIKENFDFKVQRSTTKLFVVACTEESCKWILRAVKVRDSTSFQIRKFVKEHSCLRETRDNQHRQANSWLIGQLIRSKCQGMNGTYKPREIIEDVRRELGVNLSYEMAWRARERAMNYDTESDKRHLNGSSSGRPKKQRDSLAKEGQPRRNVNSDTELDKGHLNGSSSGRQKKQRESLAKEDLPRRNKCGRCGLLGHNRQTYAIPRELRPNSSSGVTG